MTCTVARREGASEFGRNEERRRRGCGAALAYLNALTITLPVTVSGSPWTFANSVTW